ncbi:hypothetical protein [Larkinella rosea]|uniref:Uncharacterized protein n=1 Tax=Larkinella rosea TaxID=2025312 RepID=A0A3P1C2S7_9BACT|nr:hypothetical protein [Larkinella rosea]RRB07363.1 hypothetical protein EHT25_06180 [Larkinella rosea]
MGRGTVPLRSGKYRKLSLYLVNPSQLSPFTMESDKPEVPKKTLNIELLLGLSATFLSVAALIVSIFQTRIAREQQHATVWPYVQLTSDHLDNNLILLLKNNGIGPALIKKVEFGYRGKSDASHINLLNEIENAQASQDSVRKAGRFWNDIRPGDVVKAGDEIELYKVLKNNYLANFMSDVIADSTFRFRITYSDVYGNCWLLDHGKVTQLNDCPD